MFFGKYNILQKSKSCTSVFAKLRKGIRNPIIALEYLMRPYYVYICPILFKANVECPCCGWKGKKFLRFGAHRNANRNNALCPKCGALERHRLFYLYLKKIIPEDKKLKVLHFAPSNIIKNLFTSYENVDYLSADIDPRKAMVKEDITDISFPDNYFDIVFVSHVLEHIEDDRMAMKEVHRILKPDGFAILQVPIFIEFNGMPINQTYENPIITTPEEREKHFGQDDHVRVYGKDYGNRLKKAGFHVKITDFVSTLNNLQIEKYKLSTEKIYFCTK